MKSRAIKCEMGFYKCHAHDRGARREYTNTRLVQDGKIQQAVMGL